MLARYPEHPSEEQRETLHSFIYLFSRLYPWYLQSPLDYFCLLLTGISGECATHFQQHLAKYPPQVSSRNAAAGWGCFIHNEVNAMLDKPLFDCNNIGEFYDCGCAEEEQGAGAEAGTATRAEKHNETGGGNTAQSEGSGKQSGHLKDGGSPPVEISKEE